MAEIYRQDKTLTIYKPDVPKPEIGSKGFLVDKKGIFELEACGSVLRGIACTHSGSGVFEIFDGRGASVGVFFPKIKDAPKGAPNGRRMFFSGASQLGAWPVNVGLHHGLTVVAHGGTEGVPTVALIIWDPNPVRKKPVLVND